MSPSEVAFEGQSLEESLAKACQDLGVEADELDYRLDREHFLNGASTVRIIAAKKDPANLEIKKLLEGFLAEEFENREIEAKATVKVGNGVATVVIEAQYGVVPDDKESLETLSGVLVDLVGEPLGDRKIEVSVRAPVSDEPPRRDRDRDRGRGRDRDRDRGGRGRDRDRDRGRGRDRDRDRGGRGRDRDRDRDRRPERDPERDAQLERQAKEAVEQVLDDGEPVTIEELNSYERRIIHRVVAEVDGVTTRSVGRGSLKAVRILEGDDEED